MPTRKTQSTTTLLRNRISVPGYLLAGASLAVMTATMPCGGQAAAATISVSDVFLTLEDASVNDVGASTTSVLFIGADNVVPNGSHGTTGFATSSDHKYSNYALLNTASTAFPNQISTGIGAHAVPYNGSDTSLLNSWTLTFKHLGDSPAIVGTPSSAGFHLPAVAKNVTVTGGTTTPIIRWAGSGNGVFINIVDKNQCGDGTPGSSAAACAGHGSWPNTIYSKGSLPASGSWTIPPSVLNTKDSYAIEVGEVYTHDKSTNTVHHNEAAISRAIFDYTVSITAPKVPINIPMIDSSGVFHFNFAVTPGTPTYIDPVVATGYIYKIGAGNPDFASITLPNIGNINPYDLYTWNGTKFVFDKLLPAGTPFNFAPSVSEFEVLGIKPTLGLNPKDPTAFVTDLTFAGSGLETFTGTMTPITTTTLLAATTLTTVTAPEPSTWAMMLLGFASLGFLAWRRRTRAASAA
jgi:hypothetical protein